MEQENVRKGEEAVAAFRDEAGPIGGGDGQAPSIYLVACRWDWFCSKPYYPLYKVDAAALSDEVDVEPALRTVARLETDVGAKTFVPLQSRWIVGVGGDPGGTVIYDTRTEQVIRGPALVAAKYKPVVAAVGYKVYALSRHPDYINEPDFVPWFEVLDLSRAAVTATGGLDARTGWKPLPSPPCFPSKLTPSGYAMPPVIVVRSHAVVGRYILVSVQHPGSLRGAYVFDTDLEEWHKVSNKYLPFFGRAIPLGHVFIALSSNEKGRSIKAYRIRVSLPSSSRNSAAPELSVRALQLTNDAGELVGGATTEHGIVSLDKGRFSFLTVSLGIGKRCKGFDELAEVYFPTKLDVKLTTYQMESSALIEETLEDEELLDTRPEIAVSKQWEKVFRIRRSRGFSPPHIACSLSLCENFIS